MSFRRGFGSCEPAWSRCGDLLLRQRGLRVQVAHVQRALNVVLDPWAGIGDDPHRAGDAALARRAQPDPGAAIDDQQAAFGIPPDRPLQCVELVAGQEILGAFPDQRRLGDMRVAIEGREILGHRRKALNRHAVPPAIGTIRPATLPLIFEPARRDGHAVMPGENVVDLRHVGRRDSPAQGARGFRSPLRVHESRPAPCRRSSCSRSNATRIAARSCRISPRGV